MARTRSSFSLSTRLLTLLALFFTTHVTARSFQHVGRRASTLPEQFKRRHPASPWLIERDEAVQVDATAVPDQEEHFYRNGQTLVVQNANTTKFAVNGSALPEVPFDIGESYAGLLPISSNKNDPNKLFFWYFPSSNPDAKDEVTIWLNGGPGCSSLEGLLQENGPFLWQPGTFRPVKNPWGWSHLTNILYVDQPVGTGYSTGSDSPANETGVAQQFKGFFKNFIDTFGLQGKKVYITGESYAGYYVPYIADAFLNTKNKDYYNVAGIMINDPSLSYNAVQTEMFVLPFVQFNYNLFRLNQTFMASLEKRDTTCGYKAFRNKYLTYPAKGPFPNPPSDTAPGCDLWTDVLNAVSLINPCFDLYQIATICPLLWDVLGFPGSLMYSPAGSGPVYFDRPDVKPVLHAPNHQWAECANGVLDNDNSPPSALSVLPGVIERTNNTVIGHGLLDYIFLTNGTRLVIQNMTWNGAQGFSQPPDNAFFVPYTPNNNLATLAGGGQFGTYRSERGLTYVEVDFSGHMIPQFAPSASYRKLELLLGRINSLSDTSPFTTQDNFVVDASQQAGEHRHIERSRRWEL